MEDVVRMEGLEIKERLARSCILKCNTYIAGKSVDEVKRELGLKRVIKLASNENSLGPSPKAYKAMQSAISRVHFYPDDINFKLKKKLKKKLGIDEDCLIIGNGSTQLYELICKTFINEGEELVVAHPSFRVFNELINAAGGVFRAVPLKNHVHDLPAILSAVTGCSKIVVICNPNNPTGTVVSCKEIVDFLQKLPCDVIPVLDEAYVDFIEDKDYDSLNLLKENENLIILRSLSKIYGLAGLRIGYAVASPSIIDLMEKARMPFTVNFIAQAAAEAALDDEEFKRKSLKMVWEGKRKLYRELEKRGISFIHSQANFVAVNLKIDDLLVFNELLKEGIIVLAGTHMLMPGYIRVTIGKPAQMAKFIKALDKVLDRIGDKYCRN